MLVVRRRADGACRASAGVRQSRARRESIAASLCDLCAYTPSAVV
jgi:hypothetical protein